ncbi:putative glycolipid-binding domain-containing protein [Devosia ginsengisoli]|uniref:putative glycolipid-binding domain-containing protein n=1 Tax=Devosia ginsengisoli TaxID=400770 RepID=UPI0026EC5BB3|nr:putative glycolipid-binding domain-containing protein [Devosia ginsengisoli]MCR6671812.1 putative glycolipid-binding domain-containing protein [Devosia ginsengisoli]
MSLDRTIRWRGLDPVSLEHCHVISTERDTRIRGTIITPNYGLFYRIKLDDREHVRMVRLERTDGKVLELFSDGAGDWSDDRAEPLPALRHCLDIDIWPTPLTNSLPLWRCQWTIDQPQRFAMAWIDGDEMTVKRSEQIYTQLDATHFRFQGAEGFERVIEVDADFLVVDYPGLFARQD